MKKTCFIVLCIVMSFFTVFGQEAVNSSADSEIETEQKAVPDTTEKDSVALLPAETETPDTTVAGTDVEGISAEPVSDSASKTTPSEAAANTDADAVETAKPAAVSVQEVSKSSGTETVVISTGQNDGKAQEHKDIVQPVEMNEPTQRTKQRPFSMHTGLIISGTVANNMVSALDFFKPELLIDLNRLAKDTIKSGIHVGTIFSIDSFFWFTILEEHTVKFSITANGDVWGNLPKSLLDIAANGNAANANGGTIEGTLNAKVNAFADIGIMYQLAKPRYGFSARLAYFAPAAYMENPEGKYSLSPHSTNGTVDGITLKAGGTADIYGSLADYLANGNFSIVDILKNGGLDLSLTGMFRPTNWVAVTGGVDYLPLMPVVTTKGMRASFNYEGSVTNLLDSIGSGASSFFNQTMTQDFSAALPQKKIMRPLKISIGADFKPFKNDYLILSPFLTFPVLNAKPYYVDGGLKIESRFAKVLGVYLDIRCIERMWRHELCLFIDSRWFTFNLAASVASQDFKRTFTTLSGLGVKLGIGIGF